MSSSRTAKNNPARWRYRHSCDPGADGTRSAAILEPRSLGEEKIMASVVTPERFASGMTFEEWVRYVGTPENLARESSGGPRQDFSGFLRDAFENRRLTPEQSSALKSLVAQPGGPAKMLVIAEEWSS